MPPEVIGCITLAQHHLTQIGKVRKNFRYNNESTKKRLIKKHEQKVQRLVNKAVKYLKGRGLTWEILSGQ